MDNPSEKEDMHIYIYREDEFVVTAFTNITFYERIIFSKDIMTRGNSIEISD